MAEGIKIEMHNPVETIFREIKRGDTQRSVAITYAFIMRQEPNADWRAINAAIMRRWRGKSALERVIDMAWKFMRGQRVPA